MKLSEAWSAYEADKKVERYSPVTLEGYAVQARLLIEAIGDVEVEEVTTLQLKQYLAGLTHLKPSSLGHRIKFMRSLFGWLADEGCLLRNPTAKLKEPKQGPRIPKALTEEETINLKLGCRTEYEHALVEFLYSTGCRIGEVHRVNIDDINWEQQSLKVLGKGDKEGEVFFSTECAVWLKRYLKTRKDDVPSLFVSERRPYHRPSIDQLRWVVNRVADRASLKTRVYPHKLRHTFATHMLDKGCPLHMIQQFLRHTKISTTQIYTHVNTEQKRRAYQQYM